MEAVLAKKRSKYGKTRQPQQIKSVKKLLAAILPKNKFYAEKLQGIDLNFSTLDQFFTRLPYTTKQELIKNQEQHPPYGTNLTYPLSRYTRYHQTSASSGAPLRWIDTKEDWQWIQNNWHKVFRKAGIRQGDRLFFAFSFGPFLGFWSAFDAAQQLNCLCIPGGGMSTVTRLHLIRDNKITILCCTPTYAIRLGETALEEGIDPEQMNIRKIIVAGEPGGSIPATYERIEQIWRGAEVYDHHGMTEVGAVSYQCPENRGVLRIIESSYIAEVIDPLSQNHVAAGQLGELVLTTLDRFGSPLLRYRTGDLVKQIKLPPADPDTDMFALEGGILGRTDQSVSIKGVNVYPGAIEQVLHKFTEIHEYQALISTKNGQSQIDLQIEPKPAKTTDKLLLNRVQKQLQVVLSLRIPITILKPGSLPSFEMKAKRWIRI